MSALRFLAVAGGTAATAVAGALVARCLRSPGKKLDDARMATYPRPSYTPRQMGAARALLPGETAKPGRRTVTKCEPATEGSEVKICVTRPSSMGPPITDAADACSRLRAAAGRPAESFWVMLLDAANQVIGVHEAHRGTLTGVEVHPREVFRPAILGGAAAVIVAHNHPSGLERPSDDDIALTNRMREVGELVGIPLLDHLVVGDRACHSLVEQRRMPLTGSDAQIREALPAAREGPRLRAESYPRRLARHLSAVLELPRLPLAPTPTNGPVPPWATDP